MAQANNKMGSGANAQHGAKTAGKASPEPDTDEFELANELKGRNSLQGEDQERASSERQTQAEARGETDGVTESFEKMDKNVRAERDLGKRHEHGDKRRGTESEEASGRANDELVRRRGEGAG